MAENSQALQTTAEDIKRLGNLLIGNSATNLRIEISKLQRRIYDDQYRLSILIRNEKAVKLRIYNNIDQAQIESQYVAGVGTASNPQQSFENKNVTTNPDQAVASEKFRQYCQDNGILELDAELSRINSQIMELQAQIRADQVNLKAYQDSLNAAKTGQPKNFIGQALGQILPVSTDDLVKDQIAKARVSNIMSLLNISQTYAGFSTNPTTGNRAYPDERKLPRNLMVLRKIFWCQVQQFSEFSSGENKLDTDDPGSIANQTILQNQLSIARNVGRSIKTDSDIVASVKNLNSITNSTAVSEGISKRSDPILSTADSMRQQTISYPVTATRQPGYIGSWEIHNFVDCIGKWFKGQTAQHYDLPTCPNVPKPSPTSTDQKATDAQLFAEQIQQAGTVQYQNAIALAKEYQNKVNATSALPPAFPDDPRPPAPYWVVYYSRLYGDLSNAVRPIAYGAANPPKHNAVRSFSNSSADAAAAYAMETFNQFLISNGNTSPGVLDQYIYLDKSTYIVFVVWNLMSST